MGNSTLQYIDWSEAPEDAEEGAVHGGKFCGMWYKNITSEGYYFMGEDDCSWSSSTGEPLFKERIKRSSNIFTKSMLVAGKHIVETVGDEIYVVFNGEDGNFLLNPTNKYGWIPLSDYNEDLRCNHFDNMYDIVKVYTTKGSNFYDKHRLTLIWERTPTKGPTQKELQLEALQDTINKAQEQIVSLMGVSKEFLGG